MNLRSIAFLPKMNYMTKTIVVTFSAVVLGLAAYSFTTSAPRPIVAQNPLPACPPFCDQPNDPPPTEAARR